MGREGCVPSSGSNIPPQTSDQVMAMSLPGGCYYFLLNSQSGHRSWSFEKNGPCCVSVTQRTKYCPQCVSSAQRAQNGPHYVLVTRRAGMVLTMSATQRAALLPDQSQAEKWSGNYGEDLKGDFPHFLFYEFLTNTLKSP